jgi:4'-phosphopantetheinyl transferase
MLLSSDEKLRLSRLRFEHLRYDFILSHGALRLLSGLYLGVHPKKIKFVYGQQGKPSIPNTSITFNMSHSKNLAMFGFTRGLEIGVDVEHFRLIEDMEQIAKSFFCPEEVRELMSVPLSERSIAFLSCWTRKEAYIKASGKGLSEALDNFQVGFLQTEIPCLKRIGTDRALASEWTIQDINLSNNHVAAVAYHDTPRETHVQQLHPNELFEMVKRSLDPNNLDLIQCLEINAVG